MNKKIPRVSLFICLVTLLILIVTSNYSFSRNIVTIKDLEIERYVTKILNPILLAAGLQTNSVNLHLINSPEINAFVTEGNNIFVYTGLLNFIQSDDELAGVLAHEVSHITEAHQEQQEKINEKSTLVVIAGLAAGVLAAALAPNQAGNILTVATLTPSLSLYNIQLKFSREDELQADKHAVFLLSKTSFSPEGLVIFMNRLSKEDGTNSSSVDWFSTHPLTIDRIRLLKQYIQNYNIQTQCCHISLELQFVQAKIMAYNFTTSQFINQYTHKNDIYYLYGLGLSYYFHQQYKQSIRILTALHSKFPNNQYFAESLADAYYSYNKFSKAYHIYLSIYQQQPSTLMALNIAKSAYQINTPEMFDTVLKYLDIINAQNQSSPAMFHIKSMVLARMNNKSESILALAQEYFILGDIPQAKKYAQMVLSSLKTNSPSWFAAQDILLSQS